MAEATQTTDHDTIRRWVEERGGRPAAVASVRTGDDPGVLRIDFGEPEESLEPVGWDEFFRKFDESGLAFLYQDEKDGSRSRFFKFVRRSH